ncbi:hypothetical protein L6452_44731 [Arctium lappa]|nr:hypothetical protein L6452_44731 [Arctium lappa]
MEADTKTLHSFTSTPIPKTTSPQAMHVVDDTKVKSTSGDEESVVNGSKSTQCHNLEGDARKEEVSKGVDKGKGIRGDNSVESDMGRKDCDRVEKVVLGTPVHLKDADPCNHTLHEDLCHLRSAYISACHDEEINARQRAKDVPTAFVGHYMNILGHSDPMVHPNMEEFVFAPKLSLDTPDDVVDRFPNGWPNEWINRYSPLQNSPLPVLDQSCEDKWRVPLSPIQQKMEDFGGLVTKELWSIIKNEVGLHGVPESVLLESLVVGVHGDPVLELGFIL